MGWLCASADSDSDSSAGAVTDRSHALRESDAGAGRRGLESTVRTSVVECLPELGQA